MMAGAPAVIGAERIFELLSWADAIHALRAALFAGLDPSCQPARTAVGTENGELLLMPSEYGGMAGVKVASVAPGNPDLDRPRIQATFILLDSLTLTPRAIIDGAALTTLRTPALAAVAVDALAPSTAHRLVVFGAGPQAEGHVHALRAIRPIDEVRVVSRTPESAHTLVGRLCAQGISAMVGVAADVAEADLVATATSSATPVFDGALVSDHAVVTAVGSHHPGRRELDASLLRRAGVVVVEDVMTALREAGDIVMSVDAGAVSVPDLLPLGDLIRTGAGLSGSRRVLPSVFKSVGQGWQDLVVAHAVYRAALRIV